MKNRLFLLFSVFIFFSLSLNGQEKYDVKPIAVLGAFDQEIEMLKDSLQNRKEINVFGLHVTRGTLYGNDVVLAYTGMGKVNAAMTTTLILDHFNPTKVIFTGIAGGLNPELNPGDIVIGSETVQHDLNFIFQDSIASFPVYSPLTDELVPVYFPADKDLLTLTQHLNKDITLFSYPAGQSEYRPKIISGVIATGDAFIASSAKNKEIADRFYAEAVEMEGAAVAQICYYNNTPCIVIRSISDSANEKAVSDIELYFKIAALNSNLIVIKMIKEMNW